MKLNIYKLTWAWGDIIFNTRWPLAINSFADSLNRSTGALNIIKLGHENVLNINTWSSLIWSYVFKSGGILIKVTNFQGQNQKKSTDIISGTQIQHTHQM